MLIIHGFATETSYFLEPASLVLYSPEMVAPHNANPAIPPQRRIPLPSSFETFEDILQLPLLGFSTGFGDARIPPSFGFEKGRRSNIWRLHWKDTWRVRPRFTANLGLSYAYHADFANHDLNKPAYLEPLLGRGGLEPTRRDRDNFGPSVGFAWGITDDNRTVLRAGAGIYYELPLASGAFDDRTSGQRQIRRQRVAHSESSARDTGRAPTAAAGVSQWPDELPSSTSDGDPA
jgi:hypothetical protein